MMGTGWSVSRKPQGLWQRAAAPAGLSAPFVGLSLRGLAGGNTARPAVSSGPSGAAISPGMPRSAGPGSGNGTGKRKPHRGPGTHRPDPPPDGVKPPASSFTPAPVHAHGPGQLVNE